ncbi:MAG: type II toxin-antitoxin system Phd/YefM family antitoxin [Gemmatimonadaceae bacterium]
MSAKKTGSTRKTTKPAKSGTKRAAETAAHAYGAASHETWISASEFKARCLELMDAVNDRHDPIVITKHGVPVAKLVPFEEKRVGLVGSMRGTVLSYGDLISPVDVQWDADE